MIVRARLLPLACLLTLAAPSSAWAENDAGALYGTVADGEGASLPGVTIELRGMGERRLQVTDAGGRFRFLGLEPGGWSIEASLDGFSTLEYPDIDIRAGRSTTLEVELSPAVAERITVSARSPLLDERELTVGTVLDRVALEKIPNARDPWALVNQSPGVMVDRIDIGGSRSTQSRFSAPAVTGSENEWKADGVEITDQAGGGGQPISYFDLDQYAQVEISTGGNEITRAKPGVSINLVTRRGTNEFRGSGRFLVTDDDLFLFFKQSSAGVDPGEFPPGQTGVETRAIQSITNWGLEGGGPALRDRLWFWASYGENTSREKAVGGQEQEITVESVALKLNAQPSDANSLVASWTTNDKRSPNREAGPGRAPETVRKQRGPSDVLKVEDDHMFSSSFFLSGSYSKVDGGFSLTPIACIDAGGCAGAAEPLVNDDGVVEGSFLSQFARRPSEQLLVEGSYFFGAAATGHELELGARWRDFEVVDGREIPGGRDVINLANGFLGLPDGTGLFAVERNPAAPAAMEYRSLWLQDTVSRAAWTVTGGLRYDEQDGNNEPYRLEASPIFPELFPALDFPGDSTIGWESVSPRVGVTYALGEERRTLLRASYSRFAGALSSGSIERVNPVGTRYATFLFADSDLDDRWAGPSEPAQLIAFFGFDPADPAALENPNRNDPGLDPERTDELILGAERALRPDLVVGASVTWRNRSDIHEERRFVRDLETGEERLARREDYLLFREVEVEQPGGRPFGVDLYRLGDHAVFTGGSLLANGDREVEYLGASLTVVKRLSSGWMLNGFLDYGNAEWRIPASFLALDDPTRLGGDRDGEAFGESGGRFGRYPTLALNSRWSFNVNGLYRVAPERPWGFDVSANLYGREGYAIPYLAAASVPGSGLVFARAAERVDDFRYEDVITTDVGIRKQLAAGGSASFTLSADLFNAFNEGYVLERDTNLGGRQANWVVETLSPRIWRLGVRVNWR